MTDPRSSYVTCQGYEIHVTEWGDPAAEPVILWHGLARTGRDFDPLARVLAERYFVLAPDTLGRGFSQWSREPKRDYCLTAYGDQAIDLVTHYGLDRMRWVGTSMGGALGIHLAGGRLQDRISHLVINDIAPELVRAAIERILGYAGNPPAFETIQALEAFLRTNYKPYGWMPDDQWRRMAETSARRTDNGQVTVHYDPMMVEQFRGHPEDYSQWEAWDAITAQTLLYRGEISDLITPEWAEEMTRRGPKAVLRTFQGIGHAPALNVPDQIEPIVAFLAG
ncbi:MAG: alpha/beta hydrolase [Rhodospirillum sp.]|nr:alpha/beta hydrolase [Rhodospirillum sp.]MCF8492043.1 alpha/beta hydrolase [Rhodospirillum sp.]MCF8501851.1 alpha/beta hydrolase [Rhodospirillum sp.]